MKPEDFFEIVPSPEAFQFRNFNLYRIFYVELAHRLLFASHPGRVFSAPLTGESAVRALPHFFAAVWRLFTLRISGKSRGKTLLYNPGGRVSKFDGQVYDLYTPNILDSQGRDAFILYEDNRAVETKTPAPDLLRADLLPLFALLLVLVRWLMGGQIQRFVSRVLKQYPGLPFSEVDGAKIVSRFYAQYYLARFVLGVLAPGRVLIICHYTREGFLAACKTLKLSVTELMHGEITPGHSLYNLPATYATPAGRMLMPDKILVYGAYWKDILVRGNFLPPDAIDMIGYFLKVPERRDEHLPDGRRMCLIATQFTIQQTFFDYAAFLKEKLDPRAWLIVIKPHPSEDATIYRALETPGFVQVTFENIYHLLNRADVLISSYSTVLYEGARYRSANYALYNQPYQERWQEFIDSGLFTALYPGQLPASNMPSDGDAGFYFEDFHPEVLPDGQV